jgi:hypothetical protein
MTKDSRAALKRGSLIPHTRAGTIVDNDDLEHKRRAADDPDDDFDECAQRCNAAHRAEADKQAERQSEYQRQAEKLYGGNKAAHQAECYIGKHVVSSLPSFYFDT